MDFPVAYVVQKLPNTTKIRKKRKIKLYFYLYCFAFTLTQTAYYALLSLQSTLNQEGNSGIISFSAMYGTSILIVLLGASFIVQKIGCSGALIISETAVLVYVIGNFFPEIPYIFIPSSIFGGVMIGVGFTAVGAVNTQFALAYSKFSSTSPSHIISSFQSQFFGIFTSSQIFGNLLSYGIFFADYDADAIDTDRNTSHCGSNHCLLPDSDSPNFPPEGILIFRIVLPVCVLIGILINIFIIPGCGRFAGRMTNLRNTWEIATRKYSISFNLATNQRNVSFSSCSSYDNEGFLPDDQDCDAVSVAIDSSTKLDFNENFKAEPTERKMAELEYDAELCNNVPDNANLDEMVEHARDFVTSLPALEYIESSCTVAKSTSTNFRSPDYADPEPCQSRDFISSPATWNPEPAENKSQRYSNETVSEIQEEKFTIIKSTIRMIFSVKVLLRFAMMFHYGVMRGFIFVELPTAYTSCIFGIQSVSLNVAIHAFSETVVSFFGGRLIKRFGLRIPVIVAGSLSFGAHLFSLYLNPEDASRLEVYALFFLFGICNGLWLPISAVTMIQDHPGEQDIALSVWNLLYLLGSLFNASTGSIICVTPKIYIMLGTLILGLAAYGICEFLSHKAIAKSLNRKAMEIKSHESENKETQSPAT